MGVLGFEKFHQGESSVGSGHQVGVLLNPLQFSFHVLEKDCLEDGLPEQLEATLGLPVIGMEHEFSNGVGVGHGKWVGQ